MNLKSTVKTNGKATPEQVEEILDKAGMLDEAKTKETETAQNELLKNSKTDNTKKINVILPEVEHQLFKLHCGLNKIGVQEKAKELVLNWLNNQPKLGI